MSAAEELRRLCYDKFEGGPHDRPADVASYGGPVTTAAHGVGVQLVSVGSGGDVTGEGQELDLLGHWDVEVAVRIGVEVGERELRPR
jgi:hypothetical protein